MSQFAIYKDNGKGLKILQEVIFFPASYTPTEVKYALIEKHGYSGDIWITRH